MADREQLLRAMEHLAKTGRAELEALGRAFRSEMHALVGRGGNPDALPSEMDALFAEYELAALTCQERLQAELDRLSRSRPKDKKKSFEEPRRRSGPPPHRRRLPKWPPRPRPSAGGVTVEPNRPSGLSGGAAAPLEFD